MPKRDTDASLDAGKHDLNLELDAGPGEPINEPARDDSRAGAAMPPESPADPPEPPIPSPSPGLAPIAPPDSHYLVAVEGWLELGNPREAAAEWERLSPEGRRHPAALERRWQILARLEAWDAAVETAIHLTAAVPHLAAGWLHHAYALRRATHGGLPAAWEVLHAAAERFPDEDVVAYNLACYATQLGRPDEGWEWFLRALQISENAGTVRHMGLHDPDLEKLWSRIRGLPEK